MTKWNIPDTEGNIDVPDYLDPLIKTIANQFGFVLHADKNMNQAICDIAFKAEQIIAPKWVKVVDQLPPVGKTIMTYSVKQGIITRYFSKGYESYTATQWIEDVHVTHWIELPLPPNE